MKRKLFLRQLILVGKLILFVSAVFLLMDFTWKGERIFISPYSDIKWAKVGYYDAMFHTHPGLGNEEYDPHQTVDRYHQEGYKILMLAGHDVDIPSNYIKSIYPWTELSSIYEKIKHVRNPKEGNLSYEEMANGPYEDRDPVKLDMISVEGCEVTGPHHLVSLFNSYTGGGANEDESLQNIQKLGGLAYFAHPGRYVEKLGLTAEWYIDFYKRYDLLLGQAIFNRKDSWKKDRAFFDKIAHELGYERPIWLFGEDDMHYESYLGWNRNVILLEHFEPGSLHPDIQDGSVLDVRKALENGCFYLWKPAKQYNKRTFNISNVSVSNKRVKIVIDSDELVREIRWRTHNPNTSETETILTGDKIYMKDIPEYCKFIRAEIEGEGGTIYTQPFYITKN
ncbi:MAG: hypothetical protein RBS73_08640 [Prolixibacteraceae bacterium]|jgi:hypothetical protein|nr:hypothetical protein [Prolixibacteraceae bacterium]